MNFDFLALASLLVGIAVLLLLWRRTGGGETAHLRLLLEQNLAGQRAEAETTRREATNSERALGARLVELRLESKDSIHDLSRRMGESQAELRLLLEQKLRELADTSSAKLDEIKTQVNEQLHVAVGKQMETSFQRVIDQFDAVQKAMGDVKAVTDQIGDLRRVFSNVKTRGGWGETQLRALLDDMLPAGAYDTNRKLRDNADEAVEFVVHMPMKGDVRPVMAIDSKFPIEDYERLLDAAASGDADAEKLAKRGLEARLRLEARKISEKYIVPPVTVEFAVLYLPTDGLFAEIARIPGLIEEIGRLFKVLISGPSLLPAMLRTIHLGFMTMALEQKTGEIRNLLHATRSEMTKMDDVLGKLARQAGTFSNTIGEAQKRTRVMQRTLKSIGNVNAEEAALLFPIEETLLEANEDEP